ncbi:hypothetical protein [Streptomyces sp. NPDC059092]|uniref:hypothetical protein n=1 Tax=Streptomyces sp. NPDC059092 TaxID=3346725 RepID=UPI0036856C02
MGRGVDASIRAGGAFAAGRLGGLPDGRDQETRLRPGRRAVSRVLLPPSGRAVLEPARRAVALLGNGSPRAGT